ncbi:MAG: division/cell wall cluster transcriptional repressor MraZ [Propionibacteriaceae bacterium]|jgi:AbrB family looped-hinge helix DNA binding protein|nr:division/cell wall cluster transcriptional repressor MraZ [Propionibacteriaceae bacterium]
MRTVTGTWELKIDAKGRITIPKALRDKMNDDTVLVMGMGDHFEVWEKERWMQHTHESKESQTRRV